jgi:hypothetical protein
MSTHGMSWLQTRADPTTLGRVMSLVMLSTAGTQPIGLALAGGLASQNLGLLFWVCAVAIELTAAAAVLSRTVRRI